MLVEADDGEPVVLAEVSQDVVQALARLLDLLAAHTAGAIHDEDDILGQVAGLLRFDLRREEE